MNVMSTDASIAKETQGAGGCFPVITDHALEAIAVLDSNGVVHYANAAWVRMHGYQRRSEVVGRQISAFHNKEQMSSNVLPFLQEVAHRGQISGPVGHIHKNGTEVPTNTTMIALKDETGKMRGVVVYAIDTSEPKKLNDEIGNLKSEADKRSAELKLAAARLQERAKELEIVESLLSARGTELSAINKQLWQYMSERGQTQDQLQALKTELAAKEKEAEELSSRLQRQSEEQAKTELRWKTQYSELSKAIKQLHNEVIEMKHQEVEYLEDVDLDAKRVGAKGTLDRDQLKQLSAMAKKFASEEVRESTLTMNKSL
ncbi:MAG: PAS domain-containing protein [Sedimentisphaerales bacterium]|nr:PAS domain-containing protein [Sedimentisphaerales bacterium]